MKAGWLALLLVAMPLAAEEFSFDIGQYQKQPWELGGYFQASVEYLKLNQDAAFYPLSFPDEPHHIERYRGVLELGGVYRWDTLSLNGLLHAEAVDEYSGTRDDVAFYELYLAAQPNPRWSVEAGKRTLRWGKGYAFNPVAFLERPKDATDPELAREGYVMASTSYVRSFDGALRTLTITPIILPVSNHLNRDFGAPEHVTAAARLALLYRDTDIDIMLRSGGSRPRAAGLAMARNLAPQFVVHGELAWFDERTRLVLDPANNLVSSDTRDLDLLLGLRYLTAGETTWIAEYYRNGAGYTPQEMQAFYDLARASAADPALRPSLLAARQGGYGVPQPMREYLYIRVSQKEPFDALYWNAGLMAIINLHDHSASLIPELIYTGVTNLEMRGRLTLLNGGRDTDFGERQNDWRLELQARYHF